MIIADTSGLIAALDADEELHSACRRVLETVPGPRFVSPFVLAEVDYIIATHVGQHAALDVLDDVASGAFRLEPFDGADIARARQVMLQHLDLDVGLADASIVVLAERHGVNEVLTLDERHFRALTTRDGQPFRLLPADG